MEVFEIVIFEIIKQVGESQIPKAHFEILNLFNYFQKVWKVETFSYCKRKKYNESIPLDGWTMEWI